MQEESSNKIIQEESSNKIIQEESSNKIIREFFVISEMPDMDLNDELQLQIESCLPEISREEIDDYLKICPYQKQIKELLKSVSDTVELQELQAAISDLVNAAKKKQIFKKNNYHACQFDPEIKKYAQQVINIIRDAKKDAQSAYSLLARDCLMKMGTEYNLSEEIRKQLEIDLWDGILHIMQGTVLEVASIGLFLAYKSGVTALGSSLFTVGSGFAIAGLLLLGAGAWKLYQRKKESDKYSKLLEFYQEMERLNILNHEACKV